MSEAQRRAHLRRVIESKTGRSLAEVVGEMYRDEAQNSARIACACSQLVGEKVDISTVEHWFFEFILAREEERMAFMLPRLKATLESVIEAEVERRLKARTESGVWRSQ